MIEKIKEWTPCHTVYLIILKQDIDILHISRIHFKLMQIIAQSRNVPMERLNVAGNSFFYPRDVPMEQKRNTKAIFYVP